MAFDAFMVIRSGGGYPIEGETTDREFSQQKASTILSFNFTSGDARDKKPSSLAAKATSPSTTPAPKPSATPLKDVKDIPGANTSIKKLEKRIDDLEEQQRKIVESQNDALAELRNDIDKKDNETAAQLQETIEIAQNEQQTSEQTGNGTARAKKKLNLSLSKYLDSASTDLLKAYCNATARKKPADYKPFDEVVLSLRKASGALRLSGLTYLKIHLYEVDVSEYRLNVSSGRELPREDIKLSFETFKVEYTAQSAQGKSGVTSKTSIMSWDFETGAAAKK